MFGPDLRASGGGSRLLMEVQGGVAKNQWPGGNSYTGSDLHSIADQPCGHSQLPLLSGSPFAHLYNGVSTTFQAWGESLAGCLNTQCQRSKASAVVVLRLGGGSWVPWPGPGPQGA